MRRHALIGLCTPLLAGCWVSAEQVSLKLLDTAPTDDCSELVELVEDGSFEQGTPNPAWEEDSLLFDTPLCDPDRCTADPSQRARSGAWWAWFGGVEQVDTSSVIQHVLIPEGGAELSFWIWVPDAAPVAEDRFVVLVDGRTFFEVEGQHGAQYAEGYSEVRVTLDSVSDGFEHELALVGTVQGVGGVSNFFIDDVSIMGCPP